MEPILVVDEMCIRDSLYADRGTWNRMSLMNIANSGIFSADRAVFEDARNIWHAEPVK